MVRNGRVGRLKHINAWAPGSAPGGSLKVTPPPEGLNFDRWLGPAPARAHTENLCSDNGLLKTWWFVSDFALGFISGWGIHPLDIAVWGGGGLIGGSVEVTGRGTFRNAEGICDTAVIWDVDFAFASGLTLKFVGTPNGGNRGLSGCDPFPHQEEWKARYRRISEHGTSFEGSNGWAHVDRIGLNLEPEALIDEDPEKFGERLVRSPGQARNFLDCVKSRAETICPVDQAVAVDNLCHAADIAIRLGRKVTLDLKREEFRDDVEANLRFNGRPARDPWKL
jgi:predicted dehydrogenase